MEAAEKRGKVRVLVCGNAGSGKTTLLRHVRDEVDVSTTNSDDGSDDDFNDFKNDEQKHR